MLKLVTNSLRNQFLHARNAFVLKIFQRSSPFGQRCDNLFEKQVQFH